MTAGSRKRGPIANRVRAVGGCLALIALSLVGVVVGILVLPLAAVFGADFGARGDDEEPGALERSLGVKTNPDGSIATYVRPPGGV